MRDITLGITFYHDFTTRAFATGIPTQLAGTPVISALEENNATPITAGISLSVDRGTVTGLNEVTVVATGGNGFEAGKSYSLYISTGTVGGVSVVGEIVGQFTVGQSAAAVDLANVTDGLGALKAYVAPASEYDTQLDANMSTRAPASEYDTAMARITANVATEAKQDIIDTNVDQIETAVITNAAGTDVAADIIALKAETVDILADTNELQGDDIPTALTAMDGKLDTIDNFLDTEIAAIKAVTDALTAAAAAKIALSAGTMRTGTVSHDNTVATTEIFYCDDIAEATGEHYKGRNIHFTSGALDEQVTDILDYALVSGEGKFTVTALTEAPADNVTFLIV